MSGPDYFDDDSMIGDWLEDEYDELEEAFDECGRLPPELGGGCQLAGTEHCDFDCPFRDEPLEGIHEDE